MDTNSEYRKVFSMFGITDIQIVIGYLLALGFALGCVVYGYMNWHNGVEDHGS